jgi:hypothetical protein
MRNVVQNGVNVIVIIRSVSGFQVPSYQLKCACLGGLRLRLIDEVVLPSACAGVAELTVTRHQA